MSWRRVALGKAFPQDNDCVTAAFTAKCQLWACYRFCTCTAIPCSAACHLSGTTVEHGLKAEVGIEGGFDFDAEVCTSMLACTVLIIMPLPEPSLILFQRRLSSP